MKVKQIFYKITIITFIVLILFLLVSFPFQYTVETMNGVSKSMRWIIALLFACVMYFLWKHIDLLERRDFRIVSFVVMVSLQIAVILRLKIQPINDLLYLHDEAIRMLGDSKISMNSFQGYFSWYPNNHSYLVVLYWCYKLSTSIGVPLEDLVIVGNLLNLILIDSGILLGNSIIRKFLGLKWSNLWLLFYLVMPWTYFWIPYFYTHTTSFFLVMVNIYILVALIKEEKRYKRVFLSGLSGIVFIISYKIRITNSFIFIALIVMAFVFWRKRTKSDYMAICAFVFGVCIATIGYQYSFGNMLPKENSKEFPITHWIMMASHGNGRYDYNDVRYTKKIEGKEEKRRENIKKIRENYDKLGFIGTMKLVGIKLRAVWLVGDDDFTKMSYVYHGYNKFHDFLSGQCNGWLIMYSYLVRVVVLLCCLLKGYQLLYNPDKWSYLFVITMLGGMIFHCIWEANPKYSVCFMGIMTMIAILGLKTLREETIIRQKLKNQKKIIIVMSITVLLFQPFNNYLLDNPKAYDQRYAALQLSGNENKKLNLSKDECVKQSVYAKLPFQRIRYKVNTYGKTGDFIFQLRTHFNKIIYSKEIKNITNNEIDCNLPRKMGRGYYYICLVSKCDDLKIVIPVYNTGNCDVYDQGDFYIRNIKQDKMDSLFILSSYSSDAR